MKASACHVRVYPCVRTCARIASLLSLRARALRTRRLRVPLSTPVARLRAPIQGRINPFDSAISIGVLICHINSDSLERESSPVIKSPENPREFLLRSSLGPPLTPPPVSEEQRIIGRFRLGKIARCATDRDKSHGRS